MPSTPQSWDNLLSALLHSPEISHERYGLILSRVRFVSRIFSVLSLLWIAVDFACWPWPVSGALGLDRVITAGAFWILGACRFESLVLAACGAVLTLLLISSGLILGAQFVLFDTGAHAYQLFGTQGYLLSPIALGAILAIFPLTMWESALLASSLVPVTVFPVIMWPELFAMTSPMAVVLLLVLVLGISAIASSASSTFSSVWWKNRQRTD